MGIINFANVWNILDDDRDDDDNEDSVVGTTMTDTKISDNLLDSRTGTQIMLVWNTKGTCRKKRLWGWWRQRAYKRKDGHRTGQVCGEPAKLPTSF